MIASRYSIYSSLMLIFGYSFLAQYLPGRWSAFNRTGFYVTSIVMAAAFCFLADVYAYKILQTRRRAVIAGIESYRSNPEVNSPLNNAEFEKRYPKEKVYEQSMLTQAIQEGVYTLPPKQEIRSFHK